MKRRYSGEVSEVGAVNELDVDAGRMEGDEADGEHLGR
jgi:hypothetical protein